MTKAVHIALALFIATANTATAQIEPIIYIIPQDSTILDLTYPYYNIILDPAVIDPAITTTDPLTDPVTTDTGITDPAATTTDPATNTTAPRDTTTPTDPLDSTNAGTGLLPLPVDSTTLFVPPERPEPEQPLDPRQPPNEENPREPLDPRECPKQTICPSAQETINRIVPQITNNQWRIAIIVFGGAAAGGILWFLISLLFNNIHSKRERSILQTRATVKNDNHRMDQLKNSHNKISESIANLSETLSKGKNPSSKQIQTFKKAGTELELFGSSKTRSAYNNILKTVSVPQNKSTQKEFSTATKTLFASLKKDLGLS